MITPFVIVHPGHRLMPFPRPGYVMKLLVVCLGVLLRLGAPSDVLPLMEPLSLVPRVRNRPMISISPKTSVWTLGWGRGPPLGLQRLLGNPGFHPWPSECLSFFSQLCSYFIFLQTKQKDPKIIITLGLYPNMMVDWVLLKTHYGPQNLLSKTNHMATDIEISGGKSQTGTWNKQQIRQLYGCCFKN